MNRRQQIVLFLVIVALVVTWLFPYWINRYREPPTLIYDGMPSYSSYSPHYSFLFTEPYSQSKIVWGRLLLTDLIIAAVGTPILYALRSKQ
jgi:hypothetical protein